MSNTIAKPEGAEALVFKCEDWDADGVAIGPAWFVVGNDLVNVRDSDIEDTLPVLDVETGETKPPSGFLPAWTSWNEFHDMARFFNLPTSEA